MPLTSSQSFPSYTSNHGPSIAVFSDGNVYVAWTDESKNLYVAKVNFETNPISLQNTTKFPNQGSKHGPSITCCGTFGPNFIAWGGELTNEVHLAQVTPGNPITFGNPIGTGINTNNGVPYIFPTIGAGSAASGPETMQVLNILWKDENNKVNLSSSSTWTTIPGNFSATPVTYNSEALVTPYSPTFLVSKDGTTFEGITWIDNDKHNVIYGPVTPINSFNSNYNVNPHTIITADGQSSASAVVVHINFNAPNDFILCYRGNTGHTLYTNVNGTDQQNMDATSHFAPAICTDTENNPGAVYIAWIDLNMVLNVGVIGSIT